LNPASISCCRRFASVSGRSEGCSLLRAWALLTAALDFSFLSNDEVFFSACFVLVPAAPWLERQVRVLERMLVPEVVVVGEVLERDVENAGEGGARGVETVEGSVEVPDDVWYGRGARSVGSAAEEEEEDDEELVDARDLRETRRCQRSLIDILMFWL
jgi:hypothetical protein